jgi:predicted flap endonuclease-1-like 5' DNA nuclease
MLAFTTNQWAVLGLVLILGWLLGLLSRGGQGGRWRREFENEYAARVALERQLKAVNERIAELEAYAPPIDRSTAPAIGAAASGRRDDLALIRGVGRSGETRLNSLGIYRYRDLTSLSREGERDIEGRLGLETGAIEREAWREQAALLADGRSDEVERRFGRVPV